MKRNNTLAFFQALRRENQNVVPQGSILGPVIFNIFLNDIFASLNETTLYNHAYDNTICNSDKNIENVKSHLVRTCMTEIAIDWFEAKQTL